MKQPIKDINLLSGNEIESLLDYHFNWPSIFRITRGNPKDVRLLGEGLTDTDRDTVFKAVLAWLLWSIQIKKPNFLLPPKKRLMRECDMNEARWRVLNSLNLLQYDNKREFIVRTIHRTYRHILHKRETKETPVIGEINLTVETAWKALKVKKRILKLVGDFPPEQLKDVYQNIFIEYLILAKKRKFEGKYGLMSARKYIHDIIKGECAKLVKWRNKHRGYIFEDFDREVVKRGSVDLITNIIEFKKNQFVQKVPLNPEEAAALEIGELEDKIEKEKSELVSASDEAERDEIKAKIFESTTKIEKTQDAEDRRKNKEEKTSPGFYPKEKSDDDIWTDNFLDTLGERFSRSEVPLYGIGDDSYQEKYRSYQSEWPEEKLIKCEAKKLLGTQPLLIAYYGEGYKIKELPFIHTKEQLGIFAKLLGKRLRGLITKDTAKHKILELKNDAINILNIKNNFNHSCNQKGRYTLSTTVPEQLYPDKSLELIKNPSVVLIEEEEWDPIEPENAGFTKLERGFEKARKKKGFPKSFVKVKIITKSKETEKKIPALKVKGNIYKGMYKNHAGLIKKMRTIQRKQYGEKLVKSYPIRKTKSPFF